MKQTEIILIGASVRSLAESAIHHGLRPYCVDMFADADLKRRLTQAKIPSEDLRQIDQFKDVNAAISALSPEIPIVVGGGLENHLEILESLQQHRHVVGSPVRRIAQMRDPERLFSRLDSEGCAVPRFRTPTTVSSEPPGSIRWLRKPYNSGGGLNIEQVGESFDSLHTDSDASYLQEFVDGIPFSMVFYGETSPAGKHRVRPLGATLQLSGRSQLNAGEFQFCGNAGPVSLAPRLLKSAIKAGDSVGKCFRTQGLFGVDFIATRQTSVVLEVNPRITASHELIDWSGNAEADSLQIQLGALTIPHTATNVEARAEKLRTGNPPVWVRMVLYAKQHVVVTQEMSAELLGGCRTYVGPPHEEATFWLADVPSAGSEVPVHTPLCSLYVRVRLNEAVTLEDYPAVQEHVSIGEIQQMLREIQAELAVLAGDFKFVPRTPRI